MKNLIIILTIIYSFSFIFTYIDILEGSMYSRTAKKLGKSSYCINGFFVALVPILNTVGAIHWITYRLIKRESAKDYQKRFETFGDNSY